MLKTVTNYIPSGGTTGDVLVSGGSGSPTWTNSPSFRQVNITSITTLGFNYSTTGTNDVNFRWTNNLGAYWDTRAGGNSATPPFYIFNSGFAGVQVNWGASAWSAVSDERLKNNLTPIDDAISKVNTLRAVTGQYINDDSNTSRSFLIAQDVQQVLPEAVWAGKLPGRDDDVEYLNLAYTDVIPLLVAAIKELSAEINQLKSGA